MTLVARLELWPHQRKALALVREEYRRGIRRIVVVMGTGSGKTTVGCRFAFGAVDKGKRVLWIAHRDELITQAAERMAQDGVQSGLIRHGKKSSDPTQPIQIASVWTIARQETVPEADVVVWDECHHTVAKTFTAVAERYPNALHLGLTATPERADGTALGNVFEAMVAPVSVSELIAGGYLVPCDVIGPARLSPHLAMHPVNAIEQYAPKERTILFAGSVAEAEEYARRLTERGIPAGCVDGNMSQSERNAVLERFRAKEIQVLCNVYLLTEGFNVPEISTCVLARGCGSAAMYLQMVGRALRAYPGKKRALLVDLRGVAHEHGLPDEDREYSLDGKPIKTKEARIPLRTCPQCGGVAKPKPVCARCSFVFPPPRKREVREASVGEVAVRSRAELLAEWEALVRKARSMKKSDGSPYSPVWAAVKFKEKFGFWPGKQFPRFDQVAA